MTPVSNEIIEAAIQIIGTTGIAGDDIEQRVRGLVTDDMTARRLIDWIPEAFGIALLSHLPSKLILPTTFSAKTRNGSWITLPLTAEPIFTAALQMAMRMAHHGPHELFRNISLRSAMTTTVNHALNQGANIDGWCLGGPALIGIPAEVYPSPPNSFC